MKQPGEEERSLLRDSVRGLLTQYWPQDQAIRHQIDRTELNSIWCHLASLGLTRLGADSQEGGLSELLVVTQELGRAACPAPLIDSYLAHLALSRHRAEAPEVERLLEQLQDGSVQLGFAGAKLDGDRHAGSLIVEHGRAHGTLSFVDCAISLSHLLVSLDSAVVLLDCADAGVSKTATRALGLDGYMQFKVDQGIASVFEIEPKLGTDLIRIRRQRLRLWWLRTSTDIVGNTSCVWRDRLCGRTRSSTPFSSRASGHAGDGQCSIGPRRNRRPCPERTEC